MNNEKSYDVKGFARKSSWVKTNTDVMPRSMYEFYNGRPPFEELPEEEILGRAVIRMDVELLCDCKERSNINIVHEISILIDDNLNKGLMVEFILKHLGYEKSFSINLESEKQKFIESIKNLAH
jgi:hypothetical protein